MDHQDSGQKKKIFILCNSLGGFYDFRNELAQALLEKYEVTVCAPDDVRKKELEEEGCSVIKTPINRRGTNPVQDSRLYRQYRSLLAGSGPAAVLTYTIKPDIYGGSACSKLGIPYIENITGLGTTFERGGIVCRLVTVMYRHALKNAVCVFFQNTYNRDVLERAGIKWKKDSVLPGSGVNLVKHHEEVYPEADSVEFLFVGRVMREKGIGEYIAAAEKLHSADISFGIVGYCEEEYEERLKELEGRGVLRFYGFHTDMDTFYKRAGAVVVPSYHEGMSNVVLEASATGRPVIASDISGCREAVEEGVTGFLCSPRDQESLIDTIGKFIRLTPSERAEMGRNARKKMEREFDRRIVVERYMDEIKGITG